MKITVRIPTEQYAYIEVEYDTLAEYQSAHPTVAKAIVETRHKAKLEAQKGEVPF